MPTSATTTTTTTTTITITRITGTKRNTANNDDEENDEEQLNKNKHLRMRVSEVINNEEYASCFRFLFMPYFSMEGQLELRRVDLDRRFQQELRQCDPSEWLA